MSISKKQLKPMPISLNLLILSIFLISTSCATMFTGTRDQVTFNSSPQGARVVINGIDKGRTPVTIPVKRSLSETQVTLKQDGYEDRNFILETGFNGVSILNLFFLPGFIIDAATGSIIKHHLKAYEMELEPDRSYSNKTIEKKPSEENKPKEMLKASSKEEKTIPIVESKESRQETNTVKTKKASQEIKIAKPETKTESEEEKSSASEIPKHLEITLPQ